MQGDNNDATEILHRDDATSLRADPADAVTEIDRGDAAADTLIENGASTLRETSGQRPLWLAAGCILLVIILAYAAAKRQPAPTYSAQPVTDGYSAALALAATAIEQNDVRSLPAVLLSSAREMPDSPDMQALLQDATLYRDMHFLLETEDILQLSAIRLGESFHTPLFEQSTRQQIDPHLGAVATRQELTTAREAWRAGDLVAAITAAKQVHSATGNIQAKAMLLHYANVVHDYEALSGQTQDPAFAQKLVAFYAGLDPVQDRFFWSNLERDFEQLQDPLATSSAQQLQRAARLWSSYQGHAGINGAMRQAAAAGNEFRQRAVELEQAKRHLKDVVDTLHQTAQTEAEASLFPRLVDDEVRLQRDRLQMLLRFNNENVLRERLLMLPLTDSDHQQ